MPVYEYICNDCGHEFELYRKATDRPLSRCPECKGRVRKVFRPVGIIFKGSGFHCTDYASARKSSKDESKPVEASSKSE